ncbi:MAG: hypothetical protein IPP29_20735 [Bacteroidetes bacterium]|nr:hypothetical protein [Bacteroidota bacterium]
MRMDVTVTGQVTLSQPAPIGLTSRKQMLGCWRHQRTLRVVTAGGTSPYAYLWSNGKTTKYIIGLTAGTYTGNGNRCKRMYKNTTGKQCRSAGSISGVVHRNRCKL